MSINEINEFEAINKQSAERKFVEDTQRLCREEFHRVKKAKAKKKAIVSVIVTVIGLVAAMFGIIGLEMIGWINDTFRIVLMCLAGSMAMFNIGRFSNDLKK